MALTLPAALSACHKYGTDEGYKDGTDSCSDSFIYDSYVIQTKGEELSRRVEADTACVDMKSAEFKTAAPNLRTDVQNFETKYANVQCLEKAPDWTNTDPKYVYVSTTDVRNVTVNLDRLLDGNQTAYGVQCVAAQRGAPSPIPSHTL